ncbi:recombinase family protein [Planococcus rifietoensis]|nr:recombinase family protein [Planococcus soli]
MKKGIFLKKSKTFSLAAIKTIVTNPVYTGFIRYNVRREWEDIRRNNLNPNPLIQKGQHELIISMETWEIAQSVYKSRFQKPNCVHDGEFPLTGIRRCPVCNAGMIIGRTTNRTKDGTKKVLEYYVCGAWKNKGTMVCRSNGVRTDYADPFVLDKLQRLMRSDKLIKDLVNKVNSRNESKFAPLQHEYDMYEKQMKDLEQKLSKTFDAYTDELISKAMYSDKARQLEEQISQLKEHMEPLRKQVEEIRWKMFPMKSSKMCYRIF